MLVGNIIIVAKATLPVHACMGDHTTEMSGVVCTTWLDLLASKGVETYCGGGGYMHGKLNLFLGTIHGYAICMGAWWTL